jgi:hypothetical protein
MTIVNKKLSEITSQVCMLMKHVEPGNKYVLAWTKSLMLARPALDDENLIQAIGMLVSKSLEPATLPSKLVALVKSTRRVVEKLNTRADGECKASDVSKHTESVVIGNQIQTKGQPTGGDASIKQKNALESSRVASLTVSQLRIRLKALGLPTSGLKAELQGMQAALSSVSLL